MGNLRIQINFKTLSVLDHFVRENSSLVIHKWAEIRKQHE